MSKHEPNPGTHQAPVETLSEVSQQKFGRFANFIVRKLLSSRGNWATGL